MPRRHPLAADSSLTSWPTSCKGAPRRQSFSGRRTRTRTQTRDSDSTTDTDSDNAPDPQPATTMATDTTSDALTGVPSTVGRGQQRPFVGTASGSFPSLPSSCRRPAIRRQACCRLGRCMHSSPLPGSVSPKSHSVRSRPGQDLWRSYLDTSAGIPRAARAFSGPGEIVDGFTKHHKSAEAEAEILVRRQAAAVLPATPAGPQALPASGRWRFDNRYAYQRCTRHDTEHANQRPC